MVELNAKVNYLGVILQRKNRFKVVTDGMQDVKDGVDKQVGIPFTQTETPKGKSGFWWCSSGYAKFEMHLKTTKQICAQVV